MQNSVWFLASFLAAASAHGAGFEKSVMWSGKQAGYAGAGQVSSVNGSQSLYFNPAGLAGPSDVSLNFSPTLLTVQGNLASTDRLEKTDKNFLPIGGVTASYQATDRIGFGLGAYVVGGERAVYENVDLTGVAPAVGFQPKLQTDLLIMEYSLGGAIEVTPGLRVGAAWRIDKATGSLSTIKVVPSTAFVYTNVDSASQTRYEGYRVGVEYEAPERAWGAGVSYRNSVDFAATGNATGSVTTFANTTSGAIMSPVTLGLSFPSQLSFGGYIHAVDRLRLFGELDYTKYSLDDQISVNGTITSALLGGTSNLPNIPLRWKDMWDVRVGGEFDLGTMLLRAGYALTTRVTSPDDAKATLPPPGTGHMITVGAGTPRENRWGLDGAFEYAWNKGTGSMTTSTATTKELLAGIPTETKATSIAVHAGVTYRY